jgi:hypothetical protein
MAMWLRELAGKDRAPFQLLERQYFDRTAGSLPTPRKKFPLFPKGEPALTNLLGNKGIYSTKGMAGAGDYSKISRRVPSISSACFATLRLAR